MSVVYLKIYIHRTTFTLKQQHNSLGIIKKFNCLQNLIDSFCKIYDRFVSIISKSVNFYFSSTNCNIKNMEMVKKIHVKVNITHMNQLGNFNIHSSRHIILTTYIFRWLFFFLWLNIQLFLIVFLLPSITILFAWFFFFHTFYFMLSIKAIINFVVIITENELLYRIKTKS